MTAKPRTQLETRQRKEYRLDDSGETMEVKRPFAILPYLKIIIPLVLP